MLSYSVLSKSTMIGQHGSFDVQSPKRRASIQARAKESFPYYAGYAESFAKDVIKKITAEGSVVLDPWNGAGTTTYSAFGMGRVAIGFDLNPVMVVVAKARCSSEAEIVAADEMLDLALGCFVKRDALFDPLAPWVGIKVAKLIRHIVAYALSINFDDIDGLSSSDVGRAVTGASSSACVLLLAIFRALKANAASGASSNPTWTKFPEAPERWRTPNNWVGFIRSQLKFLSELNSISDVGSTVGLKSIKIECASSESIPLNSGSVDAIITSPPYCTRIDYAMATLIELAALGLGRESVKSSLRKSLLGTTAIRPDVPELNRDWGLICNSLLSAVYIHSSKGSKSYYYKNFVQYFDSLYRSIGELSRVVKKGGCVCVVLQGSYYKELPILLPDIFSEMASFSNLSLMEVASFDVSQNFATINRKSLKYRNSSQISEKVLVFKKIE